MGRIPLLVLAALAVWIGVELARHGPDEAFGGLLGLLGSPQYGEEAQETRSGRMAERALEGKPAPREDDDGQPWWSRP